MPSVKKGKKRKKEEEDDLELVFLLYFYFPPLYIMSIYSFIPLKRSLLEFEGLPNNPSVGSTRFGCQWLCETSHP